MNRLFRKVEGDAVSDIVKHTLDVLQECPYAEMDTTIVLDEQTAINYAAALTSAVADVKQFKADYRAKKEAK